MVELSELQRDALLEVFNIGLGKAAASLSAMVRQEIVLSVPRLEVHANPPGTSLPLETKKQRISAVSQHFNGDFEADAMLVFPEDKTLVILHRLLGESVPLDEFTELEQEAMSEVGNIILSACISAMADMFNTEFRSTLPTYHLGDPENVLRSTTPKADSLLLILHVDFVLARDEVRGYVAFLLNVSSFHNLLTKIDDYLATHLG